MESLRHADRTAVTNGGAGPFLKWAGGKGRLLSQYKPLFPPRFNRYWEPFLGGGAVFFHLAPHRRAVLTDVNEELVICYRAVKENVEEVLAHLNRHAARHSREHYYRVRDMDPETLPAPARAARLIYLNKTCYNGLYRVNAAGRFNVPMGRYARPAFPSPDHLRAASRALAAADIAVRRFDAVVRSARPGDFVYFDPPYHPVSPTSNFTAYTRHAFGESEQEALAEVVAALDAKGCLVMLSNSDTAFTRRLYRELGRTSRGITISRVYAARAINSKPGGRRPIPELVVRNYGGRRRG